MKYMYIYIFILLSPCLTFAKVFPHTFDVSTNIDTSFFYDETLVITGVDGLLPINDGELFINKDGTFISDSLILEAHKSIDDIIDVDKYDGETLWTVTNVKTFIDSEVKNLDLIIKVDGEILQVKEKHKDEDSRISLQVENKEKIDKLKAGQKITSILTILLEANM
ncbi:hypothetical protein [Photobacterium damselae]|uniref:hypothetical protein n=1 Tax=Photobacterium damselae TaxID=38293 RepID=UPI00083B6612|nr:hypothetical protein [Photobacterium damselae]ODA24077.1 hypothetical protein A0J46_05845 [Photobacterium damselae subsp. damselae]TLS70939.1 hypothetical protein FD718_05025 [Photobacterium damselae subsp. damselae]